MRHAGVAFAVLWCGASSVAVASVSPLREIGHIAITDEICANVVVHANSAIAASLRDDERLGRALVRLRGADLEDGSPARRSALVELSGLADGVADDANRGRDEVRRLTTLANDARHQHAGDLAAFARALDLVFDRQQKMVGDLAAFIGGMNVRDIRASQTDTNPMLEPVQSTRGNSRYDGSGPPRPSFTQRPLGSLALARALAGELEKRTALNEHDETTAADHAEAAVTGC